MDRPKFRTFCTVALVVGLALTICATAWSADVTARIRGTVTDPSGAVVPNVAITATNAATGVSFETVSQSNGNYEFLKLPVGTYNVTTSPANFRKFAASNIVLTIDQVYVLDIPLQIGQASEVVEVSGTQVQVDSTNIQLNNVINSTQITDIPLLGRNFTNLEQLFPGVQASSDRFGTYSANGSQTQQSSFLLNGTDINDLPLNTTIFTPSADAIQQFNMVTSSLNPEYSRNSGAIVSVNIKNGTNQFHGDAFDFYRDTFLNTPNYFQSKGRGGAGAPKYHQNIFGGTIGGPVWKDKLFFFFSYQGNRAVTPQTGGTVQVFTQAQRNGDFTLNSSNGKPTAFSTNPIPGTIHVPGCAAGSTWASCATVLGNKFPTSAFNSISAKLLQQYVPLPTLGSTYSFNPTTKRKQNQYITRIDFTPTSKNQFWGVWAMEKYPVVSDLPFTGATLPGFDMTSTSNVKNFTGDWTHTFNSTTLNDFRAGFTRLNYQAVFPNHIVDPKSIGFNITPQEAGNAGFPVIAVGSMFTLGFSTNGPQPRIDQNFQLTDSFSKVIGNHMLKLGWDGRRFDVNNPFANSLSGSYNFSTSSAYTTGDAGLDFLLGVPYTYGQGTGALILARAFESYTYFQDQWKFRPNLTLTYGAGWQVDTPFYNHQYNGKGVTCFIGGQQSKLFPTAPKGLNYPTDPGCDNGQGAKTTWKHIAPRVGFAWAPSMGWLSDGEAHKLSIRGGIGLYFDRTEEEGALQNLADPPYGLSAAGVTDYNGGVPQFANPWADINTGTAYTNKFPMAQYAPPGTGVDWTVWEPMSLSQYSPNFRVPYAMNYNLTIERELPSQILATLSYVGSQRRHLQTTIEANYITQAGHDACLASSSCRGTTGRTYQGYYFPSHQLYGNGDVIASAGMIDSGGSSNYNSLQLSAKKGLTRGLLFQTSFTWAHSMDTASNLEGSGWGGSSRGYNQFAPYLNYGDSAFDARYRWVFSPIYTVPNWKSIRGMQWLPDVIGKGWQVSGVMTFATGFPIDIRQSGGYNSLWCWGYFYYTCPDVPNQTANVKFVDPRHSGIGTAGSVYWFDPSVGFSPEPIGSFGNTHRNPFHGPGIINTDVMIAKNIYFLKGHENVYAQMRLESYNVFNHTQFNLPSGSYTFSGGTGAITNTPGRITGAAAGRQTQLALKIYF